MSLFKHTSKNERCGVIVDIGSGSVGVAIVVSNEQTNSLQILWTHREQMLIKNTANEHVLLKDINTALINAFLELGSAGVKTLHEHDTTLSLEHIQVALCAPWAYTITKQVHFEDERPFVVTQELIKELIETAHRESEQYEVDGSSLEVLGVRRIAQTTTRVELNGYHIKQPINKLCQSITLFHITALAREKLLQTLEEHQVKLMPRAEVSEFSFMYLFYQVLRHLHPNTTEACLIDITNEATEIGIIRDDVLVHTTYAQTGLYTLAREIAVACDVPKEEAYSMLKNGSDMPSAYGEKKRTKIEAVFNAYEENIAQLLTQTGDPIAIPRTIFLHTSLHTENFFSEHIKKAATTATKGDHTLHLITSQLLENRSMADTALALSAYYFHSQKTYAELEMD